MKAEDMPEELVTLFVRLRSSGYSVESSLARVITRYDLMYTKKMNAFFQAWMNGGQLGLDETPDSPAAPVLPVLTNKSPKYVEHGGIRGVRVTHPGNPPVIKTYQTVREAAAGEFVSVSTVRGRLNGMYTKKKLPDDPVYEWHLIDRPKTIRAIDPSGKITEHASVRDAAKDLGINQSTVYDKLAGKYKRERDLYEHRFERIGKEG